MKHRVYIRYETNFIFIYTTLLVRTLTAQKIQDNRKINNLTKKQTNKT